LKLGDYFSHQEGLSSMLCFSAEVINGSAFANRAVVKLLLLEKGAELEAKSYNGRTPLSWAAEKEHEAVVKLLENWPLLLI
jgi:ankyrin repeat protein